MSHGCDDRVRMAEAISLARRGMGSTSPNPPVGAVVCRGDAAIATGYHRRAGGPHAEVYALRSAGSKARGATLYVTLEPCSTAGKTPPCTDAIISAGIRRVVVATRDPNRSHRGRGIALLRSAGIDVTENICEDEGKRLIAPFAKSLSCPTPYTTLKLGVSLDGCIADSRGSSKWITSPASRRIVQDMRRRVDAVLVGSGTAQADDPSLFHRRGPRRNQLRIVADSSGSLSLNAKVLTDGHAANTVIATTRRCSTTRVARLRSKGATVWVLPEAKGAVSMRSLYKRLAKMDVMHVLCEGGGRLASSLVHSKLVDEVFFFAAPILLGGGSLPSIAGQGWKLGDAPGLTFTGQTRVGPDILIRAVCDGSSGPSALLETE